VSGWLLLGTALVLALAGAWLWRRARAVRQESGLPAGRVTYADTGAWRRCERPFFSRRYRLTGRPDYLVDSAAGIVPVEVKSGRTPRQPYPAHVLQLAAYCVLVEEQEGRTPPYGIIKYAGRAFDVPFTPELRASVVAMLESMRLDLRASDVGPDHDDPRRCRGCGYRDECGQCIG